jgi:hypothetical protein
MLNPSALNNYIESFFGYGRWQAPVWFVGIEEAGGRTERELEQRLTVWAQRGQKELEDAPTFYLQSGNHQWHGQEAKLQETWKQLIRMLLVARGKPDTDKAILDYQRSHWGCARGRECLADLLPLPSPSSTAWNYCRWSDLPWLQTRIEYQNYVALKRAHFMQQQLEKHKPQVVIFYASTWHRLWGLIARGVWRQAIPGKLMGLDREATSFYVTRHPRAESDEYFREIGLHLRRKHGQLAGKFNPSQNTRSMLC